METRRQRRLRRAPIGAGLSPPSSLMDFDITRFLRCRELFAATPNTRRASEFRYVDVGRENPAPTTDRLPRSSTERPSIVAHLNAMRIIRRFDIGRGEMVCFGTG